MASTLTACRFALFIPWLAASTLLACGRDALDATGSTGSSASGGAAGAGAAGTGDGGTQPDAGGASSSSSGGGANDGGIGGNDGGIGGIDDAGLPEDGGAGGNDGGASATCASDNAGRPWMLHPGGEGYHFAPAVRIAVVLADFDRLAIGDVTGDGRADIVGDGFDDVLIFPQGANGSLGLPIHLPHQFGNPGTLVLLHATPNPAFDLVVNGWMGLEVIPSLGGGAFGPSSFTAMPVGGQIEIADINLDGLDDVLVPWSSGLMLAYGDGAGSLINAKLLENSFGKIGRIALGDVTGDEIADVVSVDAELPGTPRLRVVPHDGMLGLSTTGWFTVDMPGGHIDGMDVGDVNADGLLDAVVQQDDGSYDHRGRLLMGVMGGFAPAVEIATAKYGGSVVVADANADGRDDVVMVHAGGFEIGLVLATLSGMGPQQTYGKPTAASLLDALAVGDIDCDGCPDAIGADVGGLLIFRGMGCGQ